MRLPCLVETSRFAGPDLECVKREILTESEAREMAEELEERPVKVSIARRTEAEHASE